jgi:anti-sigma B factor antagonist
MKKVSAPEKAQGEMKTTYTDGIAVIDPESDKLEGKQEDYGLWEEVEQALSSGADRIILDLSVLKWANSTGIGILVSAWTMAQKEKAELVVVINSTRLEDIFKVTNLKLILKMFATLDEAMGYFRG